jgi:LytTr DNA-binding domain
MTGIGSPTSHPVPADPVIRSLIRLANSPPVQLRWDGWLRPRDEVAGTRTSGSDLRSGGDVARLPAVTLYAIPIGTVVVTCTLNAMTAAQNISWRLGTPHNFWEPAMWEATSALVIVALLPLARIAASLIRPGARHLIAAGLAVIALALIYSALHIIGIGLLREFVYWLGGFAYTFPWASHIPYELRKDLLAYAGLVAVFWLAERLVIVTGEKAGARPDVAEDRPTPREIWLRDGRTSVLIDPTEIISVTSAGNYVEYRLTENRTHLIRATLQTQEDRLAPLGIVRLHRTRLVNLKRIVALEWRQSGDFEVRLDTGETVACSRRFKTAVAHLTA